MEAETTYTDYERITPDAARAMMGGGTATRVFHDDLGGGSEAIACYQLEDGRYVVHCTGTGDWLLPRDADAVGMCERAAHGCYVAAGFDSPYED